MEYDTPNDDKLQLAVNDEHVTFVAVLGIGGRGVVQKPDDRLFIDTTLPALIEKAHKNRLKVITI